jgi:hypothetical protein
MKKLRNIMVAGVVVAGSLVAPVVVAAPANAINVCTTTKVPPKKAWWQCAPLTGTNDPGCQWTTKTVCKR